MGLSFVGSAQVLVRIIYSRGWSQESVKKEVEGSKYFIIFQKCLFYIICVSFKTCNNDLTKRLVCLQGNKGIKTSEEIRTSTCKCLFACLRAASEITFK